MVSGEPQDILFREAREKLLNVSSSFWDREYDSKGHDSIKQALQKMGKLQNRDDLGVVRRNNIFRDILHNLSQAHRILIADDFTSAANKVGEAMVAVSKEGLQMDDLSVGKSKCEKHLPDGHNLQ